MRHNEIRTKDDIQYHYEGYRGNPALNVKVYHFPDIWDVMDHFNIDDEALAEQALNYAFESHACSFWELASDMVAEIFPDTTMYSEGRSGGWLTVHGLDDVENWDAVMLAKWRKLARLVDAEIEYLSSPEQVFDAIEVNRWAEEGAEAFNFIDFKDGSSACIVDLKAERVNA